MINHSIEILGVTPISHFPKFPPHHPCTEFCEIDKLCIPCHRITIENVRQVCLKVCINSFKIICTPAGRKLVIEGKKRIKVIFTADDLPQSIHCADFEIPFCTFVLLKNIQDEVIQVCTIVEDISVKCLDSKCLAVTSIIFVCPVFKKDHHLFPEYSSNWQLEVNNGISKFDCHDKQQCDCHTPHDKQQCDCHTPHDKQQCNCHTPHDEQQCNCHAPHDKQQCNCHPSHDKQQCNCHTPHDKQQCNCNTPHDHSLQSMCKNCQSHFNH